VAICSLIPARNIARNDIDFVTVISSKGTRSPIATSARITGHVIFSCGKSIDGNPLGDALGDELGDALSEAIGNELG